MKNTFLFKFVKDKFEWMLYVSCQNANINKNVYRMAVIQMINLFLITVISWMCVVSFSNNCHIVITK